MHRYNNRLRNQNNYNNKHENRNKPDCENKLFIININDATKNNENFRNTLWTGDCMQLTVMCIPSGCDIGLEVHHNADQFIKIEEGQGVVIIGENESNMSFKRNVGKGSAFIIPSGTCHNLVNTGDCPLKLYSIYSPPQHKKGTLHKTKNDAQHHENNDC